MIGSGRYKKALVIGVEKLSAVIDWQDRTTCVLFGDGAGAAVVGASSEPDVGLIGTRLGTVGNGADLLYISHGGSQAPSTPESITNRDHCIRMKGGSWASQRAHTSSRSLPVGRSNGRARPRGAPGSGE
jgi:3-oxoacyl-[acyl-carrier-protein] synthase-3